MHWIVNDIAEQTDVPRWMDALKVAPVVIGAIWGGMAPLFIGFVGMVMIDYGTGWLAARATGTLDSSVGERGIWRKGALLALSIAAYLAQWLIESSPAFADLAQSDTPIGPLLHVVNVGDAFTALLCWNEFTSIVENVLRANDITEGPIAAWFSRQKLAR